MNHDHRTVPDYTPLTRVKLVELITTARASLDHLHKQKILRIIDAGMEGMVFPRHCAPPPVLAQADEARALFKAHVNEPANLVALAKLEALLGLESFAQESLPMGAPSDWHVSEGFNHAFDDGADLFITHAL
jgi:hypothetical protein